MTADETPAAPMPSPPRGLPKIVWVIPAAAVVIVAMILSRSAYGPLIRPRGGQGFQPRPAPAVVLTDQHGKRHRTARYLGRRKLIVLFFDGRSDPDDVRPLAMLRDGLPQIRAAEAEVVAISSAPPETIAQQGGGSIPFPILADVDYAVHGQWGVSLPENGPLMPVLFLFNTDGVIRRAQVFGSPGAPIDLPQLLKDVEQLP